MNYEKRKNYDKKKTRVIQFLKKGKSVEYVSSLYFRTFTKGQISAFKAHVTMGTY